MAKQVRFNLQHDIEEANPLDTFARIPEPAKKIASIQFSLLRGSDIEKSSHVPVFDRILYNRDDNMTPLRNGPLDSRLGTNEKTANCSTCNQGVTDCPGHFGFIKLALPVFHVGYFKHTVSVLQVVCKSCSRVLLSEEDRAKHMKRVRNNLEPSMNLKVLKATIDDCRKMHTCIHCGAHNGQVKKKPNEALKIVHEKYQKDSDVDELIRQFQYSCSLNPELERHVKEMSEDLDPLKVQKILLGIREEDMALLHINYNFCRPSDLLITHLPAPPVCIRPSVAVTQTIKNEDDLTVKLTEIVYYNKEIEQVVCRGLGQMKLVENWNLLQWTCAQYLNSETPGLPLNLLGGKPIRALSQRIKGKHGRFRQNLSGKRVDFTGRTVISPDPNCAIDEVVVPLLMAKVLTFPDRVNRYNIEVLRALIRNGPEIHPGANFVEIQKSYSGDGPIKINLMYANKRKIADELAIGDIVERHISNGDAVLFNRQPSLHRVSIMAHRAKIMPGRTLRFNECVCTPYNADFDGDEMNIHVPQTEEARAEARVLMSVKKNICVPKDGAPLIAATQDFLTASFLLTQKDKFLNRSEIMQMCGYFNDCNERVELPPPAILKPIELWTGKQAIGVMLRPNRACNVQVNTVVKERNYSGKDEHMCLQDGYVIFQNSELLCGNLCKTTMGNGSKTGLFYSLIRDNSSDVAASCMLRVSKFSARWISTLGMSIGISDVTPFKDLIENKAQLILNGYNRCDEMIEEYKLGQLDLKAGCNAEQTLESNLNGELSQIREKAGDILKKQLPRHNAPLIMAISGSKGSNINLCQMIACVGQQTVSGSRMPNGFQSRSLPHFELESKYPAAKGFVQNSFYSGLTATEFFFHTIGGREGLVDTAVKTAETGYMQRRLMKALEDLVLKYDNTVRSSNETIIQFTYGEDGLDPLFMDDQKLPVSLGRLYTRIKQTFKERNEDMLTGDQIRLISNQAIANCKIKNMSQKFLTSLRSFIEDIAQQVEMLQRKFTDRSFLKNFTHLTKFEFKEFIKLVWATYEKAMMVPGEACGAVAAQSIGEPATQMTLKTFHFAGVASMNVTLGVPRIKEIINATDKISTPIITARLVNEDSVVSARIVKARIEKTELGDIAEYVKEVYTAEGCYLSIKLDLQAISALKLEVTVESVCQSILKTPKLKVKDKHITLVSNDKIHIEPYDYSRDKMYFVMQQLKTKLPHVIIKGYTSIVRAVISKQEKDKNKHNLLIEGYGLSQVMRTPGIDFRHTTSNHILETCTVLGIEAARQCIINEIKFTMGSYGIHIDDRHTQLLADEMTFKGQVLGITRFGVSKMKTSTLMLASFEMTTDHLYNSAIQCKKDDILGVSECIVMGNQAPIGTGLFKLAYDDGKARSSVRKTEQLLFDSVN